MSETINHPAHYNRGKFEVIEVIEDWQLGFNLGNAIKYIARAGIKDLEKEVEDLKKAAWYLDRQIKQLDKIVEQVKVPHFFSLIEDIGKKSKPPKK